MEQEDSFVESVESLIETIKRLVVKPVKRLKKRVKNLVTFIIPRHTQRTEDIVNSFRDLD